MIVDAQMDDTAKDAINNLAQEIMKNPELAAELEEDGLGKGSLFARIFGKKGDDTVTIAIGETGSGSDTEVTPNESTTTDTETEVTPDVPREDLIVSNNNQENSSVGDVIVKNTGNSYNVSYDDIYAYAPEVL